MIKDVIPYETRRMNEFFSEILEDSKWCNSMEKSQQVRSAIPLQDILPNASQGWPLSPQYNRLPVKIVMRVAANLLREGFEVDTDEGPEIAWFIPVVP